MSNENSKNLSISSTSGAMPLRAPHLEGPGGFPWREPKYTISQIQMRIPQN